MPATARPRVDVLRYRYHDADLEADRTGVYGYQGVCPCGFKTERRQVHATARRDLNTHLEFFHATRHEGSTA